VEKKKKRVVVNGIKRALKQSKHILKKGGGVKEGE